MRLLFLYLTLSAVSNVLIENRIEAFESNISKERDLLTDNNFFDANYYGETYKKEIEVYKKQNKDFDIDPTKGLMDHFLTKGWAAGYKCNKWINESYLKMHSVGEKREQFLEKLRKNSENVKRDFSENYDPNAEKLKMQTMILSDIKVDFQPSDPTLTYEEEKAIVKKIFYEPTYIKLYDEEIKKYNLSPIDHFMNIGWKKGYKPLSTFQTDFYQKYFPCNINPVLDFLRQPSGIQKGGYKKELIISLTSWPARITTAWLAIESLLRQKCKPNRVILWLSEEEYPKKKGWAIKSSFISGTEGIGNKILY